MLRHNNNAPVWLFSFVDLAFLLLIAFTQIGPESEANGLIVGQLDVPQINGSATPLSARQAHANWQLRVHPVARSDDNKQARAPFELVEPGLGNAATPKSQKANRIGTSELIARLQLLQERNLGKPILAPHRDSRSEDLLVAVGLLEDVWLGKRQVTVIPGQPVASGPMLDDPARR